MSTLHLAWTDSTILGGEADLDDFVASIVKGRGPTDAGVSLRTSCVFCLPVNHKMAGIKPLKHAGLPLVIGSGWSNDLNFIVLLARDEGLGRDITGVKEMLTGSQTFLLKVSMNGFDHCFIGARRRSGCDVGNQMRRVFLSGFGQMDLVSYPRRTPLFAVTRLAIVGGTNREG